ncbi:MAG TPA: hypothetical protein DCG58_15225 [Hyphomonas adhaerens]|uniref:Uncharacterized protein n=1 Tax=Hyphomonas adhaerens TaxID=81029 RepID=A0A3B9H1E5_9PROT|nr:hypothetical protein [Hyphomonas sp.]HAE28515.1 hypothetical protein [Hyphomonas adhaerens]
MENLANCIFEPCPQQPRVSSGFELDLFSINVWSATFQPEMIQLAPGPMDEPIICKPIALRSDILRIGKIPGDGIHLRG